MVGLKTPYGRNSHFSSFTEECLFFLSAGDMDSANSPNKTRWVLDWFFYCSESFAPVTPPFLRLHLLCPPSLLQVDEKKGSQAGGSQAAPPGMSEVSEEENLQAAEEVILFNFSSFFDDPYQFLSADYSEFWNFSNCSHLTGSFITKVLRIKEDLMNLDLFGVLWSLFVEHNVILHFPELPVLNCDIILVFFLLDENQNSDDQHGCHGEWRGKHTSFTSSLSPAPGSWKMDRWLLFFMSSYSFNSVLSSQII